MQLLAELRLSQGLKSKIICNGYIICRHIRTIKNNWEMARAYAKNYYPLFDSTREIKDIIARVLPCWYTRKNTDSYVWHYRKKGGGGEIKEPVLEKVPKTKDNDFLCWKGQ